jgi:serine/threonine-protein kinase
MPVATAEELLAALRQSKLVPTSRIAGWLDEHPAAATQHPHTLANLLVAEGLVTRYQAELLLKGQAGDVYLVGRKYKVLDLLGKGGMGAVYLCDYVGMQELVAVKVLLLSADEEDKEARDRFKREAFASRELAHKNLVRGYGPESDGVRLFLAMDFVDGIDLQALVSKVGPLPVGRAVNYIRQAAEGLAYAHGKKWVHRDIKPANLAVGRDGVVKILDMGLAKDIDGRTRGITKPDDQYIRGTADYLSPEQARGDPIDGKCDVYSLGVTLYFLLTNRLPYEVTSTAQQLVATMLKKPLPIRDFRPDVTEELAEHIEVMLNKDPQFRYSAADVVKELAPWDGGPFPPTEDEAPARHFVLSADPTPDDTFSDIGPAPITHAYGRTGAAPPVRASAPPRARERRKNLVAGVALAAVGLLVVGLVVVAIRNEPALRDGKTPEVRATDSPFTGNFVSVTRNHGPNQVPFPGGHAEYLDRPVYETITKALDDPRVQAGNCRILLLDELYQEQPAQPLRLPAGVTLESARANPPTQWTPPELADPKRPVVHLSGGSGVVVRNLSFNGLGKLATPLAWDDPGPECVLQDVRVTGFSDVGVTLRRPAGEPGRAVKLSKVRVHPSSDTLIRACVAVEASGATPARHLSLTDCRFEGNADQGALFVGGVDGLEVSRCRLFKLRAGVQFDGPGPLRAAVEASTFAQVRTPVLVEAPASRPDDRLLLRYNLFVKAGAGPVQFPKGAAAPPALFQRSERNWCNNLSPPEAEPMDLIRLPAAEPELDLNPEIKPELKPGETDPKLEPANDGFLRYPRNSPFATAANGRPVGVPPLK